MRRPTRAELHRRRTFVAAASAVALVVIAAAIAWWGPWSDDDTTTTAPSTTATTAAPATTTAPAEATTTTGPVTSTGRFYADYSEPGPVVGTGPLRTYRVEVEDGAQVDVIEFATIVEQILSDPRGWTGVDGISLQRVTGLDAQIVVTLAAPGTVDFLCYPLDTDGDVSCAQEQRAVINVKRWQEGAAPSGLGLEDYRRYLISHEVGHVLGHHHETCPGPGVPAPVMVQQTLGIGECAPNPWPASEDRAG